MSRRILAALALCAASAAPLAGQQAPADSSSFVPRQVVSLQPIHALLEWYSGEYERVVSRTTTVGVGGSFFGLEGVDYFSADAKLRYYPSGDPLRGLSFAVTVGPTLISDSDFEEGEDDYQAVGVGFEVSRSHLSGVDRRFFWGYGIGAKRLIPFDGNGLEDGELAVPTLRFSVGYAF
ncbi:MAG TPA: hypothetical protein VFX98_05850 [Longimicrobiaceae bacterium]|nr:hypothetical protein [Longimicrobiaceae bacterium]